jgi:hypothetical protein
MIKKENPNRDESAIKMSDIVFEKRLIIDLGGLHCVVGHVGGDHPNDSSIIFVEEESTLFLGDCLGPSIYSEKWFYRSEQVNALLSKLESYRAETYKDSHWKPESREEFSEDTQRLRVIAASVEDFEGNQDTLITEVSKKLGRQVNEDDLETITYFLNGLPKKDCVEVESIDN